MYVQNRVKRDVKKSWGDRYDRKRCLQECATDDRMGTAKAIFVYTKYMIFFSK
jgi:hypothetical protein